MWFGEEGAVRLEFVGLLITAVLVGALLGALWMARSARAARRLAHEEKFIQALIHWLAARRAWRMAAMKFVRSARALAQQARQSPDFEKRCRSGRRGRSRWIRATQTLIQAEAAMEAWRGDALSRLGDPPRQPTALQVRRAALRGGAERIESLSRRMKLAEQADLEWVRHERLQMRARRSVVAHFSVWIQAIIYKVVRTWERPR